MVTHKKIWLLEDDEGCRFIYGESLGIRYQIRFFHTLESFKSTLAKNVDLPDLIIADLRLPDGHLIESLSQDNFLKRSNIPFLVVSSIDDLDALRFCFEHGACDYLTKPFSKNALVIKAENILLEDVQTKRLTGLALSLKLDNVNLSVASSYFPGVTIYLTAKEFRLIAVLSNKDDNVVSRNELLDAIWGDVKVTPKVLNVHLTNLRRKLIKLGLNIKHTPPDNYRLSHLDSQDKNRT